MLLLPGLSNSAAVPLPWLNQLIGAADQAIKTYLKRDIELTAYVEFYSGSAQDLARDIVLRQFPVLLGQAQIAAGSDQQTLPQPTINVVSTSGFHPGTGGNPNATPPSISVQTGLTTYTTVTYTGTTATSFTGCSGGTGTMSMAATLNAVFSPVVFFDMGGYGGQAPNAFAPNTQLVMGTQYILVTDSGGKVSNRGLIRRIGGAGGGFLGFFPWHGWGSGRLSATALPAWPRGELNLKVQYSAGYPAAKIPSDLTAACNMLVAYMVRNHPSGAPLSSENLGAYGYSVLSQSKDIPELGSLQRLLAPYRESAWGWP